MTNQHDGKRRMTMSKWIKDRWSDDERITWDELWMNMSVMVGRRSRCSRDKVGAVIVSGDNRLLSTGYNGPPRSLPVEGPCREWCPRAIAGANDESLSREYDDCYALHAEMNALLLTETRPHDGASIYVNSTVCWQCAVNISNSGITRVVMFVDPEKRDRNPARVVQSLTELGIEVVTWQEGMTKYRAMFMQHHGLGPHRCYFCEVPMPWVEVIHHVNGDHSDNVIENLAAAHGSCHTRHHVSIGDDSVHTAPSRVQIGGDWSRVKPKLECVTCGLKTTPGWLERHCLDTGHTDDGAVDRWREAEKQKRIDAGGLAYMKRLRRCEDCGMETVAGALGRHVKTWGHEVSDWRYGDDE